MDSYDFRAAVGEALSLYDADDLISAVKRAVLDELKDLDPTADIESTPYYNHSFIPDFVLTWNESGRKSDRKVYLRPSMLSAAAGRDLENLGQGAPVFLALRSSADTLIGEAEFQQISGSPDALLTDVNAVAQIADEHDPGGASPLRALVRSNLVRGGRGLIVSDTARRINSSIDQSGEDVGELREFANIVEGLFVADAATRLRRAAQLIEMGLTGDLSLLRDDSDGIRGAISGTLSNAEVVSLIPYLLRQTGVTGDPAYWSHIGSMLTLDVLEDMWSDLAGLDLTPLIAPNLDKWRAVKAAVSADDPDLMPAGSIPVDPRRWHFDSKMLSIVLEAQWRLHVTPNGRRLRLQERAAPVPWDQIAGPLRRFKVSGVVLEGIQRRVRVSSDVDADVYGDVRVIRNSIKDEFRVPEVTVRLTGEEGDSEVVVNFPGRLVTAASPAPASELVEIAQSMLVPDPE